MLEKLPVKNFRSIKGTSHFNDYFIKDYNEENGDEYFLKLDVQYPKSLHNLHIDLPFLPERMKIEKVEKLLGNLHDKTEYVIYIRNWKQALNHGLVFK